MAECWRPISNYEGSYDVSDQGRVRSWLRPGRGADASARRAEPVLVSLKVSPSGKHRVQLVRWVGLGSKHPTRHRKSFLVAVLVMGAFRGRCPLNMEVCRKSDDVADDRLENLEWGPKFSNRRRVAARAARSRCTHKGEDVHTAVLDAVKVREIRALAETRHARGHTYNDIALQFGVSAGAVSNIVKRKSWKHVE